MNGFQYKVLILKYFCDAINSIMTVYQIKDKWYVLWNNKHILILRPYYPNIIRSSTGVNFPEM